MSRGQGSFHKKSSLSWHAEARSESSLCLKMGQSPLRLFLSGDNVYFCIPGTGPALLLSLTRLQQLWEQLFETLLCV